MGFDRRNCQWWSCMCCTYSSIIYITITMRSSSSYMRIYCFLWDSPSWVEDSDKIPTLYFGNISVFEGRLVVSFLYFAMLETDCCWQLTKQSLRSHQKATISLWLLFLPLLTWKKLPNNHNYILLDMIMYTPMLYSSFNLLANN